MEGFERFARGVLAATFMIGIVVAIALMGVSSILDTLTANGPDGPLLDQRMFGVIIGGGIAVAVLGACAALLAVVVIGRGTLTGQQIGLPPIVHSPPPSIPLIDIYRADQAAASAQLARTRAHQIARQADDADAFMTPVTGLIDLD